MLNLVDFRSTAKGLPDLLPYATLTGAWEVRGQDTASSTPDELTYISAQVNNAVKLLGTGWMMHMDAVRASIKPIQRRRKAVSPIR
jgi:type IV secretion system protein VirB4